MMECKKRTIIFVFLTALGHYGYPFFKTLHNSTQSTQSHAVFNYTNMHTSPN